MKNFNLLIALLIMTSLFSSYHEAMAFYSGVYEGVTVEGSFISRIFREITLIGIILVYFNIFWKQPLKKVVVLFCLGLLSFIFLEVLLYIFNGNNILVTLLGLRIFEYIPILYLSYIYFRDFQLVHQKDIVYYLKPLIYLEIGLGIFECIYATPGAMGQTFFGARSFGTFSSANVYGVFLSTVALMIYLIDYQSNKRLFYLIIITTFLTGSRTALIGNMIILLYHLYSLIKNKNMKYIFLALLPLILLVSTLVFSSQALSGREIGNNSPRLALWSSIISENMHGIKDFILGWGLGYGSNTVTNIFGPGFIHGQFFSDSLYIYILSSFGITGIVIFLLFLYITFMKTKNTHTSIFVFFVLFMGLPFIFLELFPSNVMIMYLWGYVLAKEHKI